MMDMVTCFSEHAVRISETTCSSSTNQSFISRNLIPSVQIAVVSQYKIILSSQKQVMITLTWCKNQGQQGLSIAFGDDPSSSFKLNTISRLFRKKRGSKTMEFNDSKIDIIWDLAGANYESGPEPVDGYYLLLLVDSQLGLSLGNLAQDAVSKKLKGTLMAKFDLVSRREHYSGNALYSTRAQFSDNGTWHDILVWCSGESEGLKQPMLAVSIDKKTVVKVKRLQWNFRGNQTVFVDGLLVDLLWDVHDWFFNPGSGFAVFMFKTRRGLDSRLWLEEKISEKDQDNAEFCLLIYASKSE